MSTAPESPMPDPVNLQTARASAQLGKLMMRLFEHWQLSAAEQAGVLGLSVSSSADIARYRRGEPLPGGRDLLDRAGVLLGIHAALRTLFPHDRDLAYRWMTTFNQGFGARPIDIALERGFEGLLVIHSYLKFH